MQLVRRGIFLSLLIFLSAMPLRAFGDPLLAASVLPTSRATQTGNTVTAFATIINAGTTAGEDCGITLNTAQPIAFSYQTTNSADNALTGTANTPVNVAPGAAQSFVMSFTMTGTFESQDIQPEFSCSNGGTAAVLSSINTILLTSSDTDIPDVVALATTINNSGYAQIEGLNGTAVFSIATSNVGDTGEVTVSADTGPGGPDVNIVLCETDPIVGICILPDDPVGSIITSTAAGSAQTFAVFVQGNGQAVVDNAALNRVFVRFVSDGVTTGLTSVALRTVEESSLESPIEVVEETPEDSPAETVEEIPEASPVEVVDESPEESPEETPVEVVEETPEEVVVEIPVEVVEESPEETPEEVVAETPLERPIDDMEEIAEPLLSADFQVWANDGGDKVVQEDIRSFTGGDTFNSTWDGTTIRTFGARNEIVSFNLVVDNNGVDLSQVAVEFSKLSNGDFSIETTNTSTASLFDWTARPIEVFTVGYLKIHGLSRLGYGPYDETHVPEAMRRPIQNFQPAAPAVGIGFWEDRPNNNKSYPDIAEPIEARGPVQIASGNSQSFWVDIYLSKNTPAGVLTGTLDLKVDGVVEQTIPVEVLVADLTLPDEQVAKTMVHMEGGPIVDRFFLGPPGGVLSDDQDQRYRQIVDNHFKLAWRHGLSMIDLNQLVPDKQRPTDKPNVDWERRLNGGLYTAAQGYDGPGADMAHDVFSIGSYSRWTTWWDLRRFDPDAYRVFDPNAPLDELRSALEFRTDQWETWFQTNAPSVDRFLFVDDEPTGAPIESAPFSAIGYANLVSQFVAENPGPGGNLDTFVTSSPLGYDSELPATSILASVIAHGQTERWDAATTAIEEDPRRSFFMYNGQRPASGSFLTEDDGVALRELAWGQYKLGISRWFYWNSNYWNNFLGGAATRDLSEVDPEGDQYRLRNQTNVFQSAHTFGRHTHRDPIIGETGGFNYSNGDGVLMYPGTDLVFPAENRGIDGPIASLRMKHWRRGIQDVQYLDLARQVNPAATQAIIDRVVPRVMWEIGVTDESDPSFVNLPPSWSNDPEVWERARAELINLILGSQVIDLGRF